MNVDPIEGRTAEIAPRVNPGARARPPAPVVRLAMARPAGAVVMVVAVGRLATESPAAVVVVVVVVRRVVMVILVVSGVRCVTARPAGGVVMVTDLRLVMAIPAAAVLVRLVMVILAVAMGVRLVMVALAVAMGVRLVMAIPAAAALVHLVMMALAVVTGVRPVRTGEGGARVRPAPVPVDCVATAARHRPRPARGAGAALPGEVQLGSTRTSRCANPSSRPTLCRQMRRTIPKASPSTRHDRPNGPRVRRTASDCAPRPKLR